MATKSSTQSKQLLTQTFPAGHKQPASQKTDSWFYVIMGLVLIVVAIAGFAPATFDTASRKEPMSWAVFAHGAVFGLWLLLFLAQTVFIKTRNIATHRRLGYLATGLAVLMVVTGYLTSINMARRGYDLSGDLIQGNDDALALLVFQIGDLLSFTILVSFAIFYRNRPETHKRLMLLATVGALMPAALTHIIGHSTVLRNIEAPIIILPLFLLLFASAIYDKIKTGKIHPVSLWVALGLFLWSNIRAVVIGPSEAWHQLAAWLIR